MSDEHITPPAHRHADTAAAGGTVTSSAPVAAGGTPVPVAGEDIHLPGGTVIPLSMAAGLTVGLVGVTIGWIWTIIGGIVFMVSLGLWIRDTRREVAHLPDELGQPAHH